MIKLVYLKRLGKISLLSIGIFLISLFLVTLLNYFNLMNSSVLNVFTYIIPFISFFIGAFILGKNSNSKGFLEGLKFSLVFILISIIINLILGLSFNINTFIYYLIIIASSLLGSIIGINKQKK